MKKIGIILSISIGFMLILLSPLIFLGIFSVIYEHKEANSGEIREKKAEEYFEIDCQSFNKNRDLYYIKYNDFLIEFDNDKKNILMSELSKFLKRKWKYRGLTLEETEKINYERWKEYCKNKNNLSPLEKILYF